ncbi:MAG: hypothetical protein AB7N76_31960 [Planctomycetota bacterium]
MSAEPRRRGPLGGGPLNGGAGPRGLGGIVVAALAFAGLVALRPRLQERQQAAGLVIEGADTAGMSADIAVPTLALGAFRGLVVDYLWMRSLALREQGRTYEAWTLAEQIGRLQPRLPAVWGWLGSHLAYDLPPTEDQPQRRWQWIQNGVALLRDQGLRYNPDASELYVTISRIYQDRVNATFDEFHSAYKTYYIEGALRAGVQRFSLEELATAPSWQALLHDDPEARHVLKKMEEMRGGQEIFPEVLTTALQSLNPEAPQTQRLVGYLSQPAGQRLLRSAVAQAVTTLFGLQPEAMLRVDREWGPLDWQSSFSAAVYWAALGVEAAQRSHDLRGEIRARRAAVLALKAALRQGRVRVTEAGLVRSPNLELIPRLDRIYAEGVKKAQDEMQTLARQDDFDPKELEAASGFKTNQEFARQDFLVEAVILLSEFGRDVEGRALLQKAHDLYPDEPALQVPYQDFLIQVVVDKVTDAGAMDTPDSVSQGLLGLWQRAFQFLALGEDARYRTYERLALARQQRWEAYLRREAQEDPSALKRLRVPYAELQRRALEQAARALPPGFRARLAQRSGVPLDQLLGGQRR